MILVADSSALIALSYCDSLHLLDKIFGDVKVPSNVYEEVIFKGKSQSSTLSKYLEGKIVDVKLNQVIISDDSLDKGELSAMILYKNLSADYLLIDDKKGRKIAELNQINIIGSVGVLLLAKKKNILGELKPLIEIIIESGIFISDEVVKKILNEAKEL